MRKNANYTILPELHLILECCNGTTTVQDAVIMKTDEIADEMYNPDYDIIVDIRGFETSLDSTTPGSIKSFYSHIKELSRNCRIAFLTTKPHQVVISEILKGLFRNHPAIEIEIFSTPEAALRYLGTSESDFGYVNNKISELNKNTES